MPSSVRPSSVRAHPSYETGRHPLGGAARLSAARLRLVTRPGLRAPWELQSIGADAPSVSTERAREELIAGWPTTVGYSANRMRLVLAVGRHESGYGMGWQGPGVGSNNMGAITAGPTWTGETFVYGDSRPEGGQDVGYETQFKVYPDRYEGWADLVRTALKTAPERAAADRGDVRGFAQAMYDAGYYSGVASDSPAQRVASYAAALTRGIKRQAQSDPGANALVRSRSKLPWLGLAALVGVGAWWMLKPERPQ